jgi:hypothetical protein
MRILTQSYLLICSESQVLESNIQIAPRSTGRFQFIDDANLHVRE